ncbi:general secretion pathway protein D [Methylophilus rhizosphaerae]|uniref:General secretion pathway protein D n=1 Tax=Methylophilus rhizosphaerae TaxID=492660 RepID=A0A1G8ZFG3_9PROT|nr:type II and III secretion system protein [Methylophilus rhizosphaerae]SDK13791.1 general secretion pathway protein D [Methylophilus rhizosphaerae]
MKKQLKQKQRQWVHVCTLGLLLAGCGYLPANTADDANLEQARLYAARGQEDEAIQLLQPLVERNPRQPQYKNWLALLQERKLQKQVQQADNLREAQQYDDATRAYQQVLQAAPNSRLAVDGLQKVQQARAHDAQIAQVKTAIAAEDFAGAEFTLRSILAEQPAHAEARKLFEELEQQKSERSGVVRPLQSSLKKKVTLELKNTPIKSAFEYLGKAGDLNFSFDQELNEGIRVNVLLRDTPVEQALDVILTSHQLGKKVLNSNTLLIYPMSRAAQYEELFVRSFYLTHMDAKRALNMMKTVLRASDLYIDEKLNTLVIRDTMDRIKVAEKLIASQDLNEPEVMLEVEVMEINRRNLENLGIQYPSQIGVGVQGNAIGNAGQPQPGSLSLTELRNFNGNLGVFSINDPAIVLNLLHQDTDTNLLASPKIRVKNRDHAKIHVGDKIPVLTSVASAQGFVSQNVNYIEVGIKLDVEPVIQMQDQVSIKVGMEVSNITDQVTTSSGVVAYTIGSRNANTTLQLRNNETQILAGLFRDDEQKVRRKVPGLGSLPIIGKLFSNDNQDKRKNEIVLLITPRIMHNISPANAVYSLIPSGVAAAANPLGAGNVRAAPAAETTPPAPVVTPESRQSSNVLNDGGFGAQIMNSTETGSSQP